MSAPADHRREIERLHEGMVVELDRRFAGRSERSIQPARAAELDPDVDTEVASTISVIREVSSVLVDLQDRLRRQEELIYDQRQSIVELQHNKQAAYAELAESERATKSERERADRAESRVRAAETQIQRLEESNSTLKAHLKSVMAVVRESLAYGALKAPEQPS